MSLCLMSGCAAWQRGITAIDVTRDKYFDLELNLWNTLDNVNQLDGLKQIFQQHRTFADEYFSDKVTPGNSGGGNEFIVLDTFYEWKVLEKDLITLNNLFEAFRMPLQEYVNEFNELALHDLTETVLNDEYFPVAKTMDQIENIMVKQGLYYKAMLVGFVVIFGALIIFSKIAEDTPRFLGK